MTTGCQKQVNDVINQTLIILINYLCNLLNNCIMNFFLDNMASWSQSSCNTGNLLVDLSQWLLQQTKAYTVRPPAVKWNLSSKTTVMRPDIPSRRSQQRTPVLTHHTFMANGAVFQAISYSIHSRISLEDPCQVRPPVQKDHIYGADIHLWLTFRMIQQSFQGWVTTALHPTEFYIMPFTLLISIYSRTSPKTILEITKTIQELRQLFSQHKVMQNYNNVVLFFVSLFCFRIKTTLEFWEDLWLNHTGLS